MDQKHPSVASFWFGPSLGFTENLCLQSYLYLGHPVVLYTYGHVDGVPEGVQIEDASQFVGLEEAERYRAGGVIQALSDRFRYLMLNKTDHIWVDTDMLAVRPMGYEDHLYGRFKNKSHLVNNAVLRLPHGNETLLALIEMTDRFYPEIPQDWRYGQKFFDHLNPTGGEIDLPTDQFSAAELPFYTCGPHALTYWLKKAKKMRLAQKADVFYPFDARLIARNTKNPNRFPLEIPEETLGIHNVGGRVFHKIASDAGEMKISPNSIVGRLCKRLNVELP